MDVFSRLFLWGEVASKRDKQLIERLLVKLRVAATRSTASLLFAIDGFAAYPKAILKVFYNKLRNARPGRPRHLA